MAGSSSQGLEQDAFRGICACITEFLCHEHLDGSLEVHGPNSTPSQRSAIRLIIIWFVCSLQAFTTETASKTPKRGLVRSQQVMPEQASLLVSFSVAFVAAVYDGQADSV